MPIFDGAREDWEQPSPLIGVMPIIPPEQPDAFARAAAGHAQEAILSAAVALLVSAVALAAWLLVAIDAARKVMD